MSYILDALKKADAERERGAVPGLRAQPVAGTAPAAAPTPPTRTQLWVVGGLVAVAGLAGSYWLGMGHGTSPTPAAAPTTLAGAVSPLNATPQPAVPPPVAVAAQAITAKPLASPAPSPKPAALGPSASHNASSTQAPPAPPVTQPPSAATPAPLLSELPADIRGPIPAITIQGSVYSETPSQRLLLANGQVLSQGASLAPDLVVVEIGKGQSEFSFRGTRFRVPH